MRIKLSERGLPRGWIRSLLRLPVALYRLRLGWLFGNRFLMLTHVGRTTGLVRRTVLEVVHFDTHKRAAVVASGWGERAHWFRNVQATPNVVVDIGRHRMEARAAVLSRDEAARTLLVYARTHPFAFREITHLITGRSVEASSDACRGLAEEIPLIRLEPVTSVCGVSSRSADSLPRRS